MSEDGYEIVEITDSDEEEESENSEDERDGRKVTFNQTMIEEFKNGQYYKKQYPDHLQCCQGMNILWRHEALDCVEEGLYYERAGLV